MSSDFSERFGPPDMFFFLSFRKTEYERDIGEYKLTEREAANELKKR